MIVLGVSNVRFSPTSFLLSQGKIRTNIPAEQVAPKNEIVPRPTAETFKASQTARNFENQGFQDVAKFGSDSPIHQVSRKWPYGGIAKEIGKGLWEAFRWDAPHKGHPYNHANFRKFEMIGGKLTEIKGTYDPHIPVFNALLEWNVEQIPDIIKEYANYYKNMHEEKQQLNKYQDKCGDGESCA